MRELLGVCENEGHCWAHELSALLEMMSKVTGGSEALRLSPGLADWFERS